MEDIPQELEEQMLKEDALHYAMEIMKEKTRTITSSHLSVPIEGIPSTNFLTTAQLIKDANDIYNYLNNYK